MDILQYNLSILNITSDMFSLAEILYTLAVIMAIMIYTTNNPIISLLFLIILFVLVATILLYTGLDFIGLSYLIVYIGAVSIMFLFILMLINIRISELNNNSKNSFSLAIFMGIILIYLIAKLLPFNINTSTSNNNILLNLLLKIDYYNYFNYDKNMLYYSTSNSWDSNLIEIDNITSIGNILYTSHNIWLLITSFILILSMIGAIIITIKEK